MHDNAKANLQQELYGLVGAAFSVLLPTEGAGNIDDREGAVNAAVDEVVGSVMEAYGRWEGRPDVAFAGGEVAEELHNEIVAAVPDATNEFDDPADQAAGIWVDDSSLIREIIVKLRTALTRG